MNIKHILINGCIGLLLILGACNRSPNQQQFNLVETSGESVKAKLDENFIFNDCGKITHKTYLYPTREWVEQKFVPYWFEYRKRNNLMYDIDATNCESFSFQSHFASQEIEGKNVAFGVFFYKPTITGKGGAGHAVNIIAVNDGDKISVLFWEPQTSKFVNLSKDEIGSCSFFYF